MSKELIMKYNSPANTDLIVFATNEFACDYNFGGVSCFSRIYVNY